MPSPSIEGFFHYGVSVRNLDRVSKFFSDQLGLNLVSTREIHAQYIESLVGEPSVWAEVRMFDFGDSTFLELLQWHGVSQDNESRQGSITSIGAQHLCLYVNDADSLFALAQEVEIVEVVSKQVTLVTQGPNSGAKVFFILVDKVLYIELFQRPHFGSK
jgi:hypothetical protein